MCTSKVLCSLEVSASGNALDRLSPYAESGVLTPAGLQSEIKTVTGEIIVASLQGEDVSVREKAVARMNELVALQKDGTLVTGTETQATLVETENLLAAGNLEAAAERLKTLQGDALSAALPFLDQIEATISARKVKDMIAQVPGFEPDIQPFDFRQQQ